MPPRRHAVGLISVLPMRTRAHEMRDLTSADTLHNDSYNTPVAYLADSSRMADRTIDRSMLVGAVWGVATVVEFASVTAHHNFGYKSVVH